MNYMPGLAPPELYLKIRELLWDAKFPPGAKPTFQQDAK